MNPASLVRMRPVSPWRTGPASGARERVDTLYHSDSLYSAITNTLRLLGAPLSDWLAATALNPAGSAVRFTSVFPLFAEHLLVSPPRTSWPPQASAKMRWKGARYVPLSLIPQILAGTPLDENQWAVDGASECVVPANQGGPFKTALRSSAGVDRLNGNVVPHSAACIEFQSGGGLWFLVSYADAAAHDAWDAPVKAAIRLLADSGFGGERGQGWGRTASPSFTDGEFPNLILPATASNDSDQHWLLSLYSPAGADPIDWSRGNYTTVERGGWVDSPVQSGSAKKRVRMIEEGSVIAAPLSPAGRAADVAPDGFPHPVFRSGFALSIRLARPVNERPTSERPVSERPVRELPAIEQPVVEQPASEAPAIEQPIIEEPAIEQSASEPPASEPPAIEQLEDEQPANEHSASELPASEQLANEHAAIEQPAIEQPAIEQPVSEQPASEPPTSEPPTSEPPTSEPPAGEHPVSEPPASEHPISESPVNESGGTE